MIIVACIWAVTLIAVTWLLARQHQRLEQAWVLERRELLNRIQRPDQIPVPATESFVFPEVEDDEINDVGTIREEPVS